VAAAAAARRFYRGLTWLGRARRASGAPVVQLSILLAHIYMTNFIFQFSFFILQGPQKKS
jgi:hypothetical protein